MALLAARQAALRSPCSTSTGAKQPASLGFGPQSGSQNRDCRQDRSRASHLARSSGISPKLTPSIWRIALARTLFSYLPVLLFPVVGHPRSRWWDTPRAAGRKRPAMT